MVKGYIVFRDSVSRGLTSTANYVDTGVASGTTYSYNVVAYDAAGNQSASSNYLTVTTPLAADITPPTVNGANRT